jgi:hypothetical protein
MLYISNGNDASGRNSPSGRHAAKFWADASKNGVFFALIEGNSAPKPPQV